MLIFGRRPGCMQRGLIFCEAVDFRRWPFATYCTATRPRSRTGHTGSRRTAECCRWRRSWPRGDLQGPEPSGQRHCGEIPEGVMPKAGTPLGARAVWDEVERRDISDHHPM